MPILKIRLRRGLRDGMRNPLVLAFVGSIPTSRTKHNAVCLVYERVDGPREELPQEGLHLRGVPELPDEQALADGRSAAILLLADHEDVAVVGRPGEEDELPFLAGVVPEGPDAAVEVEDANLLQELGDGADPLLEEQASRWRPGAI